jgi:phosphoribosylanthranilate isomerase
MAGPPPGRRTRVKVCGLTSLDDARAALEAGADWLGFIVKGESPRLIAPERVSAIVTALEHSADAARLIVVAVMVNPSPEEALELALRSRATRIQLHSVPESAWPVPYSIPAAIAVAVDREGRLTAPVPDERHLLMLDTAHAQKAGGTGQTFPWDAAVTLARAREIILAGGLGPANVVHALDRVGPFAVDASSGLERAPGIKDHDLVRRFVRAVREWDERGGRAT